MSESPIRHLCDIMARLRDKQTGCPWDVEQNFASIAPYTIEEAYEVAEAIALNDMNSLKEELGDLLLQVVFHAQMAKEEGHFTFDDVAQSIADKMRHRHPHVFGDAEINSADAQTENWERIKEQERAQKQAQTGQGGEPPVSALADVPHALPALMRAQKLGKRAARVGFDWPDVKGVLEKVEEELDEVLHAASQGDQAAIAEEMGDLLFATANLARHLGVDAETALRQANHKFTHRFTLVEQQAQAQSQALRDLSLEQLEALWQQAKMQEYSPLTKEPS